MIERTLGQLTNAGKFLRVLHASGAESHVMDAIAGRRDFSEVFQDPNKLLARYREKLSPTVEIVDDSGNISLYPPAALQSYETARDLFPATNGEQLSPETQTLVTLAKYAHSLSDENFKVEYQNKRFHWGRDRRRERREMNVRGKIKETLEDVVAAWYMINNEALALSDFNQEQNALDTRTAFKHTLGTVVQIGVSSAAKFGGKFGSVLSLGAGILASDLVKGSFGDNIIKVDGSGYQEALKPQDITEHIRNLLSQLIDFAKTAKIEGLSNDDLDKIDLTSKDTLALFARAAFVNHPDYFFLNMRTAAYQLLTQDEIATRKSMQPQKSNPTVDAKADQFFASSQEGDVDADS